MQFAGLDFGQCSFKLLFSFTEKKNHLDQKPYIKVQLHENARKAYFENLAQTSILFAIKVSFGRRSADTYPLTDIRYPHKSA